MLNVDFDEAQVVGRLALQLGDVVHVQPGLHHGFAHGDALGVFLIQPTGIELADERA